MMKITLISREFDVKPAWEDGTDPCRSFVKIELILTLKGLPFFRVKVPDKSFNYLNPFTAIGAALESQTVGMVKYDRLKDRLVHGNNFSRSDDEPQRSKRDNPR